MVCSADLLELGQTAAAAAADDDDDDDDYYHHYHYYNSSSSSSSYYYYYDDDDDDDDDDEDESAIIYNHHRSFEGFWEVVLVCRCFDFENVQHRGTSTTHRNLDPTNSPKTHHDNWLGYII